jgi:malate dehydrogenase
MGVSAYLQGEYGFSDVSIGVPCILGKDGVEKILELKLDPEARAEFENSVASIKEAIEKLQEIE